MAAAALPARLPAMWPWWLAWVVFVVYGSLVPLDFHPLPPEVAWQRLLQAPFLNIGVAGRADWIANGVLYGPVGFFTTGALLGARPERAGLVRQLTALVLGLCFGVVLAVAVETAQTAFPPRTVSRNDLLAEAIGTALGVAGALFGAAGFRRLLAGFGTGGSVLARRLAWAYALLYPAVALFPFDLLLSAEEWQAKLQGDLVGLGLADSALRMGAARLVAKLVVEALAVVPLGALWAHGRSADLRETLVGSMLRGALLGAAVESVQLALASGQSQGASVLTRAAGFAFGAWAWQARSGLHPEALRAWLRRFSMPLLAVNMMLLAMLGGAWRPPWLTADAALRRLTGEIRLVPFYYHYYTTEMQAVVSLTAVSLSYAPLGLLGWAWGSERSAIVIMTALLAAAMEAAKLFGEGTHPDPSNIGIAAVAVWVTQTLLARLFAIRPATPPSAIH